MKEWGRRLKSRLHQLDQQPMVRRRNPPRTTLSLPSPPAGRRAVRGSRGVNLFVAVACPARRRFSVYFLVCETQKEDGACASHLPFSVSFWNRSGGVSSTRW